MIGAVGKGITVNDEERPRLLADSGSGSAGGKPAALR
jgi:hypothetical protein